MATVTDQITYEQTLEMTKAYLRRNRRLYAEAEAKMREITALLEDRRWQGAAHDTARTIQTLLNQYVQALRPIHDTFEPILDTLADNINTFAESSSNVAAIQGI